MGCLISKCKKPTEAEPKEKIISKFQLQKGMSSPLIKEILNCDEFKEFPWEFENLVIEGAGTNGTVTVGAYKILESVGILQKIKQFIGSS